MIHVAHGICDKTGEYTRHLATTIASYLSNSKKIICIHILHDETLSEENKAKIKMLSSKYNAMIKFHLLTTDWENEINKIGRLVGSLTVGALFRLKLPDVLFSERKVIYLDTDIICNMPIEKMWDVDISLYSVAAVKDSETYMKKAKKYKFYKKVLILNDNYFNSGVMIFNLDKIRSENNLLHECVNFLNNYPDAPCSDQDALNYLFQDRCLFMDKKFNMIADDIFSKDSVTNISRENWHGICWHFAGEEKPWFSKKYPIFELYWEYFAQTPWGDSVEKLVHWMYKIEGAPLEEAMLYYRINSRKKFFFNFVYRFSDEVRKKLFC